MKKLFIGFLALFAFAVQAEAQQSIKSSGALHFNKVNIAGKLTVKMIPADSASISIQLNETEINRLNWMIKDSTLTVNLKPNTQGKGNGTVTLYYKTLNAITASAASITVSGVIASNVLEVDLTAGAILNMDVKVKDLYMKVGGNSAATITGSAKYYTLLSGARSKVDSRGLQATDVRVEAGSMAEVYVAVTERLQMASGTGASIFYKGSPEIMRATSKMLGTYNNIGQ